MCALEISYTKILITLHNYAPLMSDGDKRSLTTHFASDAVNIIYMTLPNSQMTVQIINIPFP